jgi:DNA-binding response OmpR family regulator
MCSVLVVDDNADLLEMVDLTLTANGFYITCILGGKTFFETVKLVNPDLILLDVFLGDMDGRTLCRRLKTESEYQNIPVILYSAGNISDSTILQSMANVFITKPFDIKHLVEKIKFLVKNDNRRGA